jgi:hypothetical protein
MARLFRIEKTVWSMAWLLMIRMILMIVRNTDDSHDHDLRNTAGL